MKLKPQKIAFIYIYIFFLILPPFTVFLTASDSFEANLRFSLLIRISSTLTSTRFSSIFKNYSCNMIMNIEKTKSNCMYCRGSATQECPQEKYICDQHFRLSKVYACSNVTVGATKKLLVVNSPTLILEHNIFCTLSLVIDISQLFL